MKKKYIIISVIIAIIVIASILIIVKLNSNTKNSQGYDYLGLQIEYNDNNSLLHIPLYEKQKESGLDFNEKDILSNLMELASYEPEIECSDIPYSVIFDDTVLKKIKDTKFQEGIRDFITSSDEIYSSFEYLEKGNLTFINTGRTWSELPEELKKLPFSGFLCGCGTYLRRDGEILMHQTIPKKRCEEIPVILKECRIGMILEGTDNVYFPSEVSRFREVEQTRAYFAAVGIGLAETAETKGIIYDKFCIVTDAQSDIERMYREFEQEFDIMDRRGGVYEIVPHGCSKGTAVDYALKQFQLEKEDAYVFGDSSNDLTMFRCGAHTIALGKHDEVLDPYTEYVTDTVERDGVAKAMEHYGLI